MATAADKAREKADRMAARRQPATQDAPEGASPAATSGLGTVSRAERTKPVRLTVDLTPSMHADLEDWARDTARAAGRTRITRVDVVRELVRQLLADPELASRVRGSLTTDT